MVTQHSTSRYLRLGLLVLVISGGAVTTWADSDREPVRVFVITPTTEFIDAQSKQIADSTRDVTEALGKKKAMVIILFANPCGRSATNHTVGRGLLSYFASVMVPSRSRKDGDVPADTHPACRVR